MIKTGILTGLAFFLLIAGVIVNAAVEPDDHDVSCNSIEYFYKKGCPHCQIAGEFLSIHQ